MTNKLAWYMFTKYSTNQIINKIRMGSTFQSKLFQYLQSDSNNIKNKVSGETSSIKNILKCFDMQESRKLGSFVSSKLYIDSMKIIENSLMSEELDKTDLIKMLFYVGLQKNTRQAHNMIRNIIQRLQKHIDQLTKQDTYIVANTIFKTSTKSLEPSIIKHITNTLNENFDEIINDPATLVCLIKIYRQFSIFDYKLLKNLSSNVDIWAKNFTVNAHILALFAEARYSDEKALNFLLKAALCDLERYEKVQTPGTNSILFQHLRAKDVARFLWALSVCHGNLPTRDVSEIVLPWLLNKLNCSNEYIKKPSIMLDSLLSLCIMGHYSVELMAWITSQNILNKVLDRRKIQPWVKLKLLQSAVRIERPELYFEFSVPDKFLPEQTVEDHLTRRPPLQRLFTAITRLAPIFNFETPTCQFQIPALHIVGIVLTRRHYTLHIELLDQSICLYQSTIPTGIMQLKLRLLDRNGHRVLSLKESELPNEDDDYYMYLEDQLRQQFKHLL